MVDKNLFDKLAAEEEDFLNAEFFCPVIRGRKVRVRISGIIMNLDITKPRSFTGWGVFRATSHRTAVLVREASMAEKTNYFNLFPLVRFILCAHKRNVWLGIPAYNSDSRFKFTGMVPISLPHEVQLFETVMTHFDGSNCWYERTDNRHDPRIAVLLRENIQKLTAFTKLSISGMTQEEREAYNIAFAHELEERKDQKEERIKDALKRGGAQYRSYVERGNTYTVEYTVDGRQHRSVIDRDTLAVNTAGVCLSGTDDLFDLQSLVGVIREGQGGAARDWARD